MSIAVLSVDLVAKFAEFQASFDRAAKATEANGAKMQKAFQLVGAAVGGALGVISVGGLIRGLFDTVNALDDLADRAQGLGIVSSQLSSFELSAQAAGVQSEEFGAAVSRLNRQLAAAAGGNKEAVKLFQTLGIAIKDANGNTRDTGAVLGDVADRFAKYADGANKSALAQELFGRSGAKLIAFLNEGREGLTKFSGATDEQIRKAQNAQKSIDEMSAAWQRFTFNVTAATASILGFGGFNSKPIKDQIKQVQDAIDIAKKELEGIDPSDTIGVRGKFLNAELDRLNQRLADLIEKRRELEKPRPQAPAQDDTKKEKERAEFIEQSRLALAAFVESIDRQASALQGVTLAEQALFGIQKGRFGQLLPAQEEWLIALAKEEDLRRDLEKLNESASRRDLERLRREQAAEDDAEASFQSARQRVLELSGALDEQRAIAFADAMQSLVGVLSTEQLARAGAEFAGINQELSKGKTAAEELGLTFASAFEDAIVEGKKFRDILQGIAKDILRIFVRRNFTEPGAEFFGGLFGDLFKGGGAPSGGSTGGGGGFGDTIRTSIGGGVRAAGTTVNVNQTVQIQGGAQPDRRTLHQLRRETAYGVEDAIRRGAITA